MATKRKLGDLVEEDQDCGKVAGESTATESGDDSTDVEMAGVPSAGGSGSSGYRMDPGHLQVFYDRLFPFNEMFNWLCYGQDPDSNSDKVDKKYFHRREFTFIKEGDIYLRYKCFKNKTEYRNEVRKHKPLRIEIGPFYNVPPSMKSGVSDFKPLEKELVFDIDMTDYDDVRSCCQDKQICNECWPLMSCAIKVIDMALRDDFGFEHLLWVFSGRRGVHCWVADKRARMLGNDGRYAVGQYLNIHTGEKDGDAGVDIGNRWPLHPSLDRAFEVCSRYFQKFAKSQDLFGTPEKTQKILKMLPNDKTSSSDMGLRDLLAKSWLEDDIDKSSSYKYSVLIETVNAMRPKGRKPSYVAQNNYNNARKAVRAIVFFFVYPRLDINVTRQLNHLLKSPFVVHPGTGNVCVPIKVKNSEGIWQVDKFDPLQQPKLHVLNDELNKNASKKTHTAIEKTSLNAYKRYFMDSFLNPLMLSIRNESKAERRAMDF